MAATYYFRMVVSTQNGSRIPVEKIIENALDDEQAKREARKLFEKEKERWKREWKTADTKVEIRELVRFIPFAPEAR